MTTGTLCFIEQDGKFLMQRKDDKKFGGGKWNAPGGKIAEGETPEACVVREVFEETGLKIRNLNYHGLLKFFLKGNPFWAVHVYTTKNFSGVLKDSSAEGILEWLPKNNLPYDKMWPDDRHWLPLVIAGKKIEGNFHFTDDMNDFTDIQLKEVN